MTAAPPSPPTVSERRSRPVLQLLEPIARGKPTHSLLDHEKGPSTAAPHAHETWATTIAHRGGGWEAAENTLLGIRRARALPGGAVKLVEIDVRLSSDGVAVLMHDSQLERTTDGKGPLAAQTFAALRALHVRSRPWAQDEPETIPTLDEAVVLCHELGLCVLLDVKVWSQEMAQTLVDCYHKHPWLYDEAVVCCFNPWLLQRVWGLDAKILRALIWMPRAATIAAHLHSSATLSIVTLASSLDVVIDWAFRSWLWWYAGGVDLIMIGKDVVNEQELQMWRKRGHLIVAWTVNDEVQKVYFRSQLQCAVITDNPRHVVELVSAT